MRHLLRPCLVVVAVAVGVAGCSSDGSDGPEVTGPRDRAVEQLRDYGLTAEQARCVTDELGADVIVEATDLNALAQGAPYQDAIEGCTDGG